MFKLLTLASVVLIKVESHTYGGYAPSTAHGHDLHAPPYLHQVNAPIHRMVAHEPMYASSHSHSIYPTSRNSITYGHDHNLAYGHANTIYSHDHIGSAKAGWVRVAGHTKPSSADKRQVHTVVKLYALDEKVFLPLQLELVRQSRKEVGCIAYELFKNADEKASDNYALFAIWRTSEDEERHMRTPYIQAAIALNRAGKGGLDQSKGRDGLEKTRYISLAADSDEQKINHV